jgi:hypothetical protein
VHHLSPLGRNGKTYYLQEWLKRGTLYLWNVDIAIVKDTGIHSDHNMVVSKIDLGIQRFDISKEKKERIDFCHIMNIPVALNSGHDHPTLNENAYKG